MYRTLAITGLLLVIVSGCGLDATPTPYLATLTPSPVPPATASPVDTSTPLSPEPPTDTAAPPPSSTEPPTVEPPTAEPPTPAPTVDPWPPALSQPGTSKIGIHVLLNDDPRIMEFIRRVKPRVVKAVDNLGWLADAKLASPQTVTIGRFTQVPNRDILDNKDPSQYP
nr:hypothetical protein [Chloroflexota bacterium]